MTKPMTIMIVLFIAFLIYTWQIWVPQARDEGRKEGVAAATDTLQPVIDALKKREQALIDLNKADKVNIAHSQLLIDSLNYTLKASRNDRNVYPLVPSVDAVERHDRIVAATRPD